MKVTDQELINKLKNLEKQDYESWSNSYVGNLFFGEFIDEIKQVIADRKTELPVDSLSDQDIVNQMRALSTVEMFLDDFKGAKDYQTFIDTFDLEEDTKKEEAVED